MQTLRTAVAVGLMAVLGGVTASAQGLAGGPTVTLHVTDYARVPPGELAAAEAYATRIYRAAGIETIWATTPWRRSEAGSLHLRVVILSADMTASKCKRAQFGPAVMGTAIDGIGDGAGRIAYIFASRIAEAAGKSAAPFERGLGHVMAHEVGHLLLGSHSHSPTGLMAPDWNPREKNVRLTSAQAQRIRARAAAPVGLELLILALNLRLGNVA
jgi:hypothetical protein